MSKQIFIQQVGGVVTEMARLEETIKGMAGVFTARGYQVGGSDPILDIDIQNAGSSMTAAQFNIIAGILGDYLSFCGNTPVITKDRKVELNKARTDI
jgi:hypothetical protein